MANNMDRRDESNNAKQCQNNVGRSEGGGNKIPLKARRRPAVAPTFALIFIDRSFPHISSQARSILYDVNLSQVTVTQGK